VSSPIWYLLTPFCRRGTLSGIWSISI
jgi:hypothetical protein